MTLRLACARSAIRLFLFFAIISFICPAKVTAQKKETGLYKVLTLQQQAVTDIPANRGINGIYQLLLKLQTTASLMHTQAHPDDEQADLLTYMSRGKGVRTAILSLNRGEGGSNILGSESFDQLGILRTEEFIVASGYYGLDDLYFTNLADYGYSKRVEEAYEKWGRQNVLREMVRVIRVNRPLVIVSRFHGSERDGHGNHQAAGEISQEAFRLAGDPSAYPEQITKDGLRVWKPLKLYRGGVNENEHWNVSVNTGIYSPWLSDSYVNFAMLGYSFHRSQFGGQLITVNGDFIHYYERRGAPLKSTEKETGFFAGIDTSIHGILKLTGEPGAEGIQSILLAIEQSAHASITQFNPGRASAIIPFLTKGLNNIRKAIRLLNKQPEARFLLQIKEQQFMDAINAITGTRLTAIAMPLTAKEPTHFYEQPVTMDFVVPSQSFKVSVTFNNNNPVPLTDISIHVAGQDIKKSALGSNKTIIQSVQLTVPGNSKFSRPYYERGSIQESSYGYIDSTSANLPKSKAAYEIQASYKINGELVLMKTTVQSLHANLPYGFDAYPLKITPALAVNLAPRVGVIVKNDSGKIIPVQIELVNNRDTAVHGVLKLEIPEGWKTTPASLPFSFTKAGERNNFSFRVLTGSVEAKTYTIRANAISDGHSYSTGYDLSTHRDLDETLFYHEAISQLKGIDVKVAAGLRVGYIMGAGDDVPAGIRQLGVEPTLLSAGDLANVALDSFDVILIGTRAYAVRQDLQDYNGRLLDFAKKGGHLIVLFQTPEFIPNRMGPYPALLPGNPEEVSEEDSPVRILQPGHRVFNYPNKIINADFDDWVEQRGSKFFSAWDTAYTAMIVTQDKGQAPQSGGWLMAAYGKGSYTYFAYALHRQLPNGVEGAYRILANLLSYSKRSGAAPE